MLPESRILKNQYHNERIVSLILEQKVEMDPLTGTPKFWKKQPLPSEAEINAEIHKMYNQIQDKYGIPGLVGNYPRYVSKSLVMATEKKYGKEYAENRRKAYKSRHRNNINIKGSAGYYAGKILW